MKSPEEKYSPDHSSEFYSESMPSSPQMRSLAPPQFKLESSSPVQLSNAPAKAMMDMEAAITDPGSEPNSQFGSGGTPSSVPPPTSPLASDAPSSSLNIWDITNEEDSFSGPVPKFSGHNGKEAEFGGADTKSSKSEVKASKSKSNPPKSEAKASKASISVKRIPRQFRESADEAVKTKIDEITKGKFKVQRTGKGQQAEIRGGVNYVIRSPSQKAAGANVARHLSTMLKMLDGSQEEVQFKVKEQEKILEWSNNKKSVKSAFADGKTLKEVVAHLKGLQPIKDLEKQAHEYKENKAQKFKKKKGLKKRSEAEKTCSRLFGHWKKLQDEASGDYSQFMLKYVDGRSGQHGETKLTKTGGGDHIYGTMRPCLACFIYFHMAGVDTSTYNPKHGPSWKSKNARLSIVELMWEQYGNAMLGGKSQRSLKSGDWKELVAKVMKEMDWAGAAAKITSDFNVSKGTTYKGKDGKMTHRNRAFNGDTSSEDGRSF